MYEMEQQKVMKRDKIININVSFCVYFIADRNMRA